MDTDSINHVDPTRPFSEAYLVDFESQSGSGDRFCVQIAGASASPRTLLLCLHGANYSSASFSLLAGLLSQRVCVAAYDARGHGRTLAASKLAPSSETLCDDLFNVVEFLSCKYGQGGGHGHALKFVLLGHSMGGAIATHAAAAWADRAPPDAQLAGLIVMDVVEGSALEALPGMTAIASKLASLRFGSPDDVVQWALTSGTLHLRASAEISVPYEIEATQDVGEGGAALRLTGAAPHSVAHHHHTPIGSSAAAAAAGMGQAPPPLGREGDTTDNCSSRIVHPAAASSSNSERPAGCYKFIASDFLLSSAPHWRGWFTGCSARFLGFRGPKLLVLADVSTLDTALTVGQMQGKFSLAMVAGSGHVVHEDAPDVVANAVASFLSRNGLVASADADLLAAKLARARAGISSPPSLSSSTLSASASSSASSPYRSPHLHGTPDVGSIGGNSHLTPNHAQSHTGRSLYSSLSVSSQSEAQMTEASKGNNDSSTARMWNLKDDTGEHVAYK